jgi:hypothetical protein
LCAEAECEATRHFEQKFAEAECEATRHFEQGEKSQCPLENFRIVLVYWVRNSDL